MDNFKKSTLFFQKTIQSYLNARAAQDVEFAAKLANSTKSIDDCIHYIFSQVYKSGCVGFENDEIFGMAVHYYDEENIQIDEIPNLDLEQSRIITNSAVTFSDEDMAEIRAEARKAAIAKATDEARKAMENEHKSKPKNPSDGKKEPYPQLDLFGEL